MRRLLVLVCGAAALALSAPAPASAGGFVVDFGTIPANGLKVYSYSDCPGYCSPQAISITLERAGTIVASAPPATYVYVPVVARAGDVVRIYRDGVERASVTHEGGPVVDGPGCLPAGTTVLSGILRRGDPAADPLTSPPAAGDLELDPQTRLKAFRGAEQQPAALTGAGNRWRAELSRPLDGPVGFLNAYAVTTPVGTATVWAWSSVDVCPPPSQDPPHHPPSTPPSCRAPALQSDPSVRHALEQAAGRLTLGAVRRGRARLNAVPACAGGTVAVTVSARKAVVARGSVKAGGDHVSVGLARTRRAARLTGRRRARATVTVHIADAGGEAMTWSRRVTLR